MMIKIYVEAADVWDYFRTHMDELRTKQKLIAERTEYGVEILLTEEHGCPVITAVLDEEEQESGLAISEDDCYEIVTRIYDEYLSDDFINRLIDDAEGYTSSEQLDMIDEREMELDDAVYALLDVFIQNLCDITDDPDALCEDVKEHICEYLFRKHDISIYRPMYLECEDGTDEFFEFPYDEIDFDD